MYRACSPVPDAMTYINPDSIPNNVHLDAEYAFLLRSHPNSQTPCPIVHKTTPLSLAIIFVDPIRCFYLASHTPIPSWLTHVYSSAIFFCPFPQASPHKLILSKLIRSPLFTLRTTPSLKNFSSPPAVRPPMYMRSAPSTSRNPSLELSLPRRCVCCGGMGIARGGCRRAACAAAAACAAGPPRAAEVGAEVVAGAETEYEWDLVAVGVEVEERVEGGCGRKALKKPERKKGRCVEGAMVCG